MFNRKASIFWLFTGLMVLATSASAVLLDVDDPNLKVDLGEATVFVQGTVGSVPSMTATIPLTIWYEGTPPTSDMGPMRFTVLFDEFKLDYQSAAKTASWGGNFDATHNQVAGLDEIVLVFGGTGAIPTTPTVFANLVFFANCQEEHSVNELSFKADCGNSHIVINGDYFCYTPEGWTGGAVTIDDYQAHFDIPEVSAFLGQDIVEIPVTAQTNFRMFGYHHKIEFDHSKLEFVDFVHNPDLLPGGCYDGYCYPTDNGTYLDITIINNDDENNVFVYYTPELPTPTWLYTIRFRVLAAADNQTIPLTFLTDDIFCWPYNANSIFPYCDMLVDPIDFNSGSVIIPDYMASYKSSPMAGNMISPNGTVEFNIGLQNNFPAGLNPGTSGPTPAIRVNFDLGSNWNYPNKTWESDDFHFASVTFQNGTLLSSFFHTYDATKTNWRDAAPEFRDLFKVAFQYTGAGPATYLNRYTTLPFTVNYYDGFNLFPARVVDTSVSVTLEYGSGLNWTSEPVEFKVGEFQVPNASNSGSYNVTHVLSIRNNFPLDEFSVKVNVGNNHTISSVTPYLGLNVGVEYITSRQRRIYSTSGFNLPPNGNEYTPIATITYHSVADCFKPSVTMTSSYVTFTEPIMKQNGVSQFTVLTGARVSSKCHGTEPPPPIENPVVKEETELIPITYRLYQNHPNPFNPETIISFDVPKASHVKLTILNILGQQVAVLVDEYKTAGKHQVTWRGTDQSGAAVSSGIYLAIMQSGEYARSIKMSLMK
ncbi:MAG: FlgD immunoglobulin-like domain containing protein [Candidatus Zixiibacteriota bacterium]